jgi:hypothetical protein
MPNPLLVPIVAHRMFGRRYVARRLERRSGRSRFGAFEPLPAPAPLFVMQPEADTAHGTRRTVEDVTRLFHEGESPAYTREWSVNRIWRDTGVQFVLVGVVDQMLDSDLADFLPRDGRRRPDVTRLNYPGALNVFLFREIEGAWGNGNPQWILLSDRWELVSGSSTREDAWRADVITLAHELGHAFRLSHRGQRSNVMYGDSTARESTGITAAQGLFSLQGARQYRRPWFRGVSNLEQLFLAAVETPHVRGHAGERLPAFD